MEDGRGDGRWERRVGEGRGDEGGEDGQRERKREERGGGDLEAKRRTLHHTSQCSSSQPTSSHARDDRGCYECPLLTAK